MNSLFLDTIVYIAARYESNGQRLMRINPVQCMSSAARGGGFRLHRVQRSCVCAAAVASIRHPMIIPIMPDAVHIHDGKVPTNVKYNSI